jgi:hypothetical protein
MHTPTFVAPTPVDENHLFLIERGLSQETLLKLAHRYKPWKKFAEYAKLLPREDKIIEFISTYSGEASYLMLSGPMQGKRIKVRYLTPDWYLKDWGVKKWNLTLDEYKRDIVNGSGIVDYLGCPVTEDVLSAVKYFHGGEYAKLDFKTAKYVVGTGWQVVEPEKM